MKFSSKRPAEFCQYVTCEQKPVASAVRFADGLSMNLERRKATLKTDLVPYSCLSVQQAVHDVGGMASLLVLFAKVATLVLLALRLFVIVQLPSFDLVAVILAANYYSLSLIH